MMKGIDLILLLRLFFLIMHLVLMLQLGGSSSWRALSFAMSLDIIVFNQYLHVGN